MEAINLKGLKIVDDEEELFIHTEVTNEEQPNLSLCLVGHFVTKRYIRVSIMNKGW